MIAETASMIALDALRYFTIGEGAALMLVSLFSVIDAWVYAWPGELRTGIVFRWFGRFGLVFFGSFFTYHRLHHGLNWYTPWTCATFTVILVGTWITRRYEFFWRLKPRQNGEPELRLREPL